MNEKLEAIPKSVLSELPLFPLPNVVFFPGMLLPLNVFEPRYLDLITHCLERDRIVAIPLLKPGYQGNYEGQPAIHSMVGAHVATMVEARYRKRNPMVTGLRPKASVSGPHRSCVSAKPVK